jgi:hypothetical protein
MQYFHGCTTNDWFQLQTWVQQEDVLFKTTTEPIQYQTKGYIWYDHIFHGLSKLGYTWSKVDKCVFYHGKSVFLVYTAEDGICLGPNLQEISKLKQTL